MLVHTEPKSARKSLQVYRSCALVSYAIARLALQTVRS